jgi:Universal stress protein family
MLIKKILCLLDLSEDANTGMAYAVSVAREHKAELVFFHVTRFPSWEPRLSL